MNLTDNPLAASADPQSSHQAADRHAKSGRRRKNAERVLALVRRFPGWTACELWQSQKDDPGPLSRHEVSRRLPDLEKAALVRKGKARRCTVAGTTQTTWLLTAHGAAGVQGTLFRGVT